MPAKRKNTALSRKRGHTVYYPRPSLDCEPGDDDVAPVILNLNGTAGLGKNRLQKMIKETLAEAVNEFSRRRANGDDCKGVSKAELANASAHWMRNTSATHQGLQGVSLRARQKNLGHASLDTTMIYDHIRDADWQRDADQFHLNTSD